MIRARDAFSGNDLAGESAETALHAIANHCTADLLGDGEADPNCRIGILAIADEQDETGCRRAPAGIRRDEVGAPLERD